jgi:soluble lytic murein transglycosylase-like protein
MLKFLCGPIRQGFAASLTVLLMSLLSSPACLFEDEQSRCISPAGQREIKRAQEISAIHSLLLANQTDLPAPSAREAAHTIWEESKKHALDPMLVLALIKVESQFRHRAVSNQGARGLMQLMPAVASALAVEAAPEKWQGKNSLDNPVINIKIGVFYIARLQERFGDWEIALTAYNWGPTRVQSIIERKLALPLSYARKVLSMFHDYRRRSLAQADAGLAPSQIAIGDEVIDTLQTSQRYA